MDWTYKGEAAKKRSELEMTRELFSESGERVGIRQIDTVRMRAASGASTSTDVGSYIELLELTEFPEH